MPPTDLIVEYALMQTILVLAFLAAWKRKPVYVKLRAGVVYLLLVWRNLTYKDRSK